MSKINYPHTTMHWLIGRLTYSRKVRQSCLIILLVLANACSTTRHLPEGSYLLDKYTVHIDSKAINRNEIITYVQQKPNDPKIGLRIYNWTDGDSTKWIKRLIRRIGQAPVLYNAQQTQQSAKEIELALKNKGYLNAEVTVSTDTINRKIGVNYFIKNNGVYKIRNYTISMPNKQIDSLLLQRHKQEREQLVAGSVFDMALLENERTSISNLLRNRGYYSSTKDNLHYLADTSLQSHQVDLTIILQDSIPPRPYTIKKISVYSGFDPLANSPFKPVDTVWYKGLKIIYDSTRFIRPSMLYNVIKLQNGKLYTERYERMTYNYISTLGSVSRGNIQYTPIDDSTLLCNIYLTQGNIHGIQLGLDGTNKAGDLGIAANALYSHYNIFNGSEQLDIKLRGAYEFISRNSANLLGQNFFSYGVGTSLSFPQVKLPFFRNKVQERFTINSAYSISFDIQKRPEYIRDFFNFNWRYNMSNESKTVVQSIALINVNYVIMPWVSQEFQDFLDLEINALSRYSYEDIFTAGMAYNITLTNANARGKAKKRKTFTVRYGFESSGNLLVLLFKLMGTNKSGAGMHTILGNPVAQYIKNDFSVSRTTQLSPKHSIALHTALGLAVPYGNSTIMPFEKRYFAGGPNSIRGWRTRYLGPGSYVSQDLTNPAPHVGDIRIEFNVEYRYKWMKYFEPAVFFDAGNIWTIRNYENQQGGLFKLSSFYQEFALGTGIGMRLDFNFLIVRIDGGKQVYNPARPLGQRWTFFEGFRNNSAVYFAIGYPF